MGIVIPSLHTKISQAVAPALLQEMMGRFGPGALSPTWKAGHALLAPQRCCFCLLPHHTCPGHCQKSSHMAVLALLAPRLTVALSSEGSQGSKVSLTPEHTRGR